MDKSELNKLKKKHTYKPKIN